MKNKRYNNYLYLVGYLLILRVVLQFTVGINFFSVGIIFDLFLVMFWIGAIAIFMKKVRTQKIFYIVVASIGTLFTVLDSIYYDYFETISSKQSIKGAQWLAEGTTLEYNIQIPVVAFIITPLFIGILYLIIKNKERDVFYLNDFFILSGVFIVQVGLFIFWGINDYDSKLEYYRSDAYLFESMYDRVLYSEKYGYYNYHLLDFTRIRTKYDVSATTEEIDLYFESKEEHVFNEMSNTYQDYNVVTILVESMDTRFIDPILTPNLYTLKSNGFSFSNYFTPVFQQGATCNSEYMSLTGQLAITTNDWSNNICDTYGDNVFDYTLPIQLNQIGYDTYYFHSGHEWFYNRDTVIDNYGFDQVYFQEDLQNGSYPEYTDRFDSDMILFWDEYVNFENRFYVNMLTYSLHGAYNQEEFDKHGHQVEAAHPSNDFDPTIINYMEKMVEFDHLVGAILDKLEEEGQLDNTLLVIYPDHFPYMLNRKTYSEHIEIDYDSYEIMRQDLIIYATDMEAEVFEKPGSTVDITPTLLNMVYADATFDYYMGNDLFSSKDNYVLFSDLTITDGENFLFINKKLFGDEEEFEFLEIALQDEITSFEIEKKLLEIDYFRVKQTE